MNVLQFFCVFSERQPHGNENDNIDQHTDSGRFPGKYGGEVEFRPFCPNFGYRSAVFFQSPVQFQEVIKNDPYVKRKGSAYYFCTIRNKFWLVVVNGLNSNSGNYSYQKEYLC